MSSENTLPEFSLKIMFIVSIGQYFNSGDGIILGCISKAKRHIAIKGNPKLMI